MDIPDINEPGWDLHSISFGDISHMTFIDKSTLPGHDQRIDIPEIETEENSGLSCSYYEVYVRFPHKDGREPYMAECTDIIRELQLTPDEANIFKELWRNANARLGKKKKGNTQMRAYEKIYWSAEGMLRYQKRKEGYE